MNFAPGTIKTVAAQLLGEPNTHLSSDSDLRYGTHGSLSISSEKNTFYDHEQNEGGGILDLIRLKGGIDTNEHAVDWLKEHGLEPDTQDAIKPRLVKSYDYRDEAGILLMQVQRFEPKKFVQRKPFGNGWEYKVKDVKKVPYRLPELLASPLSETVYIVEGEKDANRLAALGLVATCNAGGAGKWQQSFAAHLQDRVVIVLPDNDAAGRDHAQKVAKSLKGFAASIRILELPNVPDKGDVSDWLDAGGTTEELLALETIDPGQHSNIEGDEDDEKKASQTDQIVNFTQANFELIHDRNGDVFARDIHTGEVRRLGGRQFKDRLIAGFYKQTGMAVRDQSLRESMATLQAIARFNGQPRDVFIRCAKAGDKYYLDMCEPGNSKAIELGAGFWKVTDCPPVLFVRGDAMQPIKTPVHGGKLSLLWQTANIPEKLRVLVVTWLIECLRTETPYPGLELIGEQGSGKSIAAEALRRVIDPSSCNLRGAPKTVEDIFVAAGQNHIVAYENISHLAGAMQDALAILSTGGGYAKRQLYSDAEEHIINVRRPWLINGIAVAVSQQDLVDRVISIDCPNIEARNEVSKQWLKFDEDLPSIVGGLLDVAAKALAILPSVQLAAKDRPRMVEFVMLGQAVAQSAGFEKNEFLNRFNELRAETVARTIDSSPVASAILEFIEGEPSGITASIKEILSRLERYKPTGTDSWPRSPKGLGDALRRAAPALRQVGIQCKTKGKVHGVIFWNISTTGVDGKSPMSPCPPMSPDLENPANVQDKSGDLGTLGTCRPLQCFNENENEVF